MKARHSLFTLYTCSEVRIKNSDFCFIVVFLTSNVVLCCVKKSLQRLGLIKIFQTCGSGSIAIDPLMLLFTKYKTTCLTIISIHCLAASPAKDV